jgi:hypothetical protein
MTLRRRELALAIAFASQYSSLFVAVQYIKGEALPAC